jgi:hypothetical protein
MHVIYHLNVLLLMKIYWYDVLDCTWKFERTGRVRTGGGD